MKTFWHAIDPADAIFCHNLKVSQGKVIAAAYLRAGDSALSGLQSPYEAFTREREKEEAFEKVRSAGFDACPPRLGSIFLFDDLNQGRSANEAWWDGRRVLLETIVVEAKRMSRFDSKHLDRPRAEWDAAARDYWSGSLTANPRVEVLVDGVVQLRGWEAYARLLTVHDSPA